MLQTLIQSCEPIDWAITGSDVIPYINYDVIFSPTMTSERLANRLVHKSALISTGNNLGEKLVSLSFLQVAVLTQGT